MVAVCAAAADASRTVRPEAEIEKEEGARMADCKEIGRAHV